MVRIIRARYVEGDHGDLYPPLIDRKAPGETIRIENDLEADADPEGVGVTVDASVWAVHADDDDAALTLSSPAISGFITSTAVAGGTDLASYRIKNTITLSDGQILERTIRLPIEETRARTA